METTIILIGIRGHKGSGKDTFAKALITNSPPHWNSYRIAFADKLKVELAEYLRVDYQWIEERKNIPKVRELLQWWGADYKRVENPRYWLNQVDVSIREKTLNKSGIFFFVIPDVRFKNEGEYIRDRGGFIYAIQRKGFEGDNHSSETEQLQIPVDGTVFNDQTTLWLEKQAIWILDEIRNKLKL